jgi:hypothetical protein
MFGEASWVFGEVARSNWSNRGEWGEEHSEESLCHEEWRETQEHRLKPVLPGPPEGGRYKYENYSMR